jgi:outer membrane autotransporter barrel domain
MFFARARKWVCLLLAVAVLSFGDARAEELTQNGRAYLEAVMRASPGVTGSGPLFNNLTGDVYANSIVSSLSVQQVFRGTLPSVSNYSQTAHRQNENGSAGDCTGSNCAPDHKWVTWATPFMQWDVRKRTSVSLGYDTEAKGFATGITRLLGENTIIGLAVGYDKGKQEARDGYLQKIDSDTFHSAIYGGTSVGCFFVDAYAGYSWSSKRSERAVPRSELNNAANFNDSIWSTGFKASHIWVLPGDLRIVPAVGLDYRYIHQNSIQEQVRGMLTNVLFIDSADYHSLQTPVTLAVNKTFASDFLSFGGIASLWTPEVRVGWVPQFGSRHASVNVNADDVVTFTSKSAKLGGTSSETVGAGLKMQLGEMVTFGIDYDYSSGEDYDSHLLTGKFEISF